MSVDNPDTIDGISPVTSLFTSDVRGRTVTTPPRPSFGQQLRALMVKRNVSAQDLADAVGVTKKSVYVWLASPRGGAGKPAREMVPLIERALNAPGVLDRAIRAEVEDKIKPVTQAQKDARRLEILAELKQLEQDD